MMYVDPSGYVSLGEYGQLIKKVAVRGQVAVLRFGIEVNLLAARVQSWLYRAWPPLSQAVCFMTGLISDADLGPVCNNPGDESGRAIRRAEVSPNSPTGQLVQLVRRTATTAEGGNLANSGTKLGQNHAILRIEIDGIVDWVYAISAKAGREGSQDAVDNLGLGFNVVRGIPNGDLTPSIVGERLADVDAEFKVLQHTLGEIVSNHTISGSRVSVDLYTEQIPCSSCSDVIVQFYDRVAGIVGDKNVRMSVSWSFTNQAARKNFYGFN